MKKFRFRLKTLLELALKLEEQQLLKTKEAEKQLQVETQRLAELSERRQETVTFRQRKAVTGCTIQELIELQSYLDYLDRQIEQQRVKVVATEEMYQQEMAVLLERMRQRKMLENLRARTLEDFRRQQLKEEQQRLDELALVRYWYQEHR